MEGKSTETQKKYEFWKISIEVRKTHGFLMSRHFWTFEINLKEEFWRYAIFILDIWYDIPAKSQLDFANFELFLHIAFIPPSKTAFLNILHKYVLVSVQNAVQVRKKWGKDNEKAMISGNSWGEGCYEKHGKRDVKVMKKQRF